MLNILYVDNNSDYREKFTAKIKDAGFDVDSVVGPIEGLELMSKNKYNIVISELDFDSISGFRFLESVANISQDIKRVILTNNDDPKFEIEAIKSKVDLFLLKDRGDQLALDSINVLNKDIKVKSDPEKFLVGKNCDLKMNLINHIVTIKDQIVHLTPKEFEILRLLLINKNKYLSRKTIIEAVWNNSKNNEVRIVDTHIKKIREKTGCFEIATVRGYGYMWRE